MRRVVLLLVALSVLGVEAVPAAAATDLGPYRGLGTWVDVFDYAERAQPEGAPPPVTPESVDDMAALGARTLYLQVVNPVGEPPTVLFDAELLGEFLSRAHDAGLDVVAWYLPTVVDVDADYTMLQRIAAFRSDGRGFDGVALDLEDTQGVPDVVLRNDRIVDLAKRTRTLLGKNRALGAIVYPAVQTELINPILWPKFPYRRLGPSVDVWMPMAYFTFRDVESGYRDPLRYTEDSVTLMRAHLRNNDAPVHVIGGIADLATAEDYVAFLKAARRTKAVGYSMYDFRTTSSAAWTFLRRGLS
ncbi:MAG: hypothetical protein WD271_02860 [Acidimicrobiia bacterium]